jgi:L-threonylcarbamoyladenylate synthase
MIRLKVDPLAPEPDIIERAARAIQSGGILAMPTDTLYGLAVDPSSEGAVQRLFAVKARPSERAVPLVAADIAQIAAAFGQVPDVVRKLGTRFWPGPLTVLLPLQSAICAYAESISGGTDRVGVRVPDHAVTRAVCRAAGRLLTATSANPSGRPATNNPDDVAATLGEEIDLLLDAGPTPGGSPSTIVDVTDGPRLVRAGAIPWEAIQECLER